MYKSVICSLLLSAILGSPANLFAQLKGESSFFVDYLHYPFDDNAKNTFLQIPILVPASDMIIVKKEGKSQATLKVDVYLQDEEGNIVREKNHKQVIKEVPSDAIFQFDFIVPVSTYFVRVDISGPESPYTATREKKVDLQNGASLRLSSIELSQEIRPATGSDNPESGFWKEGQWVIPNPSGIYTDDKKKSVPIFFKVYGLEYDPDNSDVNDSFQITYTLSNQHGNINFKGDRKKPGSSATIIDRISIEKLGGPGKIDFEIEILDKTTGKRAKQMTSFHLISAEKPILFVAR